MLELDKFEGTDNLGMFPPFLKWAADILDRRLCVVFLRLLRLDSLPAFMRQADVTQISTDALPVDHLNNYRSISIT